MHCLLKQYHPYVVERHGKVSTRGLKRKQGVLVKQYFSLNHFITLKFSILAVSSLLFFCEHNEYFGKVLSAFAYRTVYT
jgi:hypothetical protein